MIIVYFQMEEKDCAKNLFKRYGFVLSKMITI